MDKYDYDIPERFMPLSSWAYFGYGILFAIPIIGFILLIVFSLSEQNINRRNYARSYFCALLVVAIIIVILALMGVLGAGIGAGYARYH